MMGKGKRGKHLVCTTLEVRPWSLPAAPAAVSAGHCRTRCLPTGPGDTWRDRQPDPGLGQGNSPPSLATAPCPFPREWQQTGTVGASPPRSTQDTVTSLL